MFAFTFIILALVATGSTVTTKVCATGDISKTGPSDSGSTNGGSYNGNMGTSVGSNENNNGGSSAAEYNF